MSGASLLPCYTLLPVESSPDVIHSILKYDGASSVLCVGDDASTWVILLMCQCRQDT